jgi:hypothetical protein
MGASGGTGAAGGMNPACSPATTCSDSSVTLLAVAGAVAHGATVTACGCGFGSKSPAAPILYDDFESGALGEPIAGPQWSVTSSTAGQEPRYSDALVRPAAGQHQSAFQNFVGAYNSSLTVSGLVALDEIYFHGWYHAIPSGAPTRNTKLLYLAGSEDWGEPDIRFFDVYYPDSPNEAGHNQFDDCNNEYLGDPDDDAWHDGKLHPNEWVRMEGFAHLGTAGQRDGRCWLQRRTETVVDRGPESPQALLRYDECTYDRLHIWSYFANDEGTPTPGLELYWDEIYVDRTQARIELGNAATWAGSTHFEIQIPTDWSSTAVTFRVSQGTAANGETAYLYVIDSAGNVNADGYPVTVGP